jgi:hypothetical protein
LRELELSYEQPAKGMLAGSRRATYYLVKAEEGQRLNLDLLGPLYANFDLYVRYGKRPSNLRYDLKSTGGSSKESITIDSAKKGSYYVMVYSTRGSGDFTLTASSGSKPSALVLTSKGRLIAKYGQSGFEAVEQKMKDYIQSLKNAGIVANLLYVDDSGSLSPYGLQPVNPESAEEVKSMVDVLDKKLNPNYVTIIGGHSVIPFHTIQNPVKSGDPDKIVHSDNPYASRDADILLPERSLGRLPDDSSDNPAFLVSLLELAANRTKKAKGSSFGYSAKVWTDASDRVFDSVRFGEQLKASPPILHSAIDPSWIKLRKFMYFNLHGSETTKNWYGQDGSNYPVAFRPENISEAEVENAIVCCEACYGANTVNKGVDDALSLKFLQKKAACFMGSTKVAYGPAEPPSTDADLIVLKFLERIKEGLTFGDAFLRAKNDFARESIATKGYLDKTEEKTLLEFVLYADPMLKVEDVQ